MSSEQSRARAAFEAWWKSGLTLGHSRTDDCWYAWQAATAAERERDEAYTSRERLSKVLEANDARIAELEGLLREATSAMEPINDSPCIEVAARIRKALP